MTQLFLIALIVPSSRGEPMLLYKKFTYNKNYICKNKMTKWCCSSRISRRCKVVVVTDCDNKVVGVQGEHTHGPVLIKGSRKGLYVLLYRNYTYSRKAKSKKGTVWMCNNKDNECKASLTTDENLNVVLTKGKHTHTIKEIETKPKHVYFTTDK